MFGKALVVEIGIAVVLYIFYKLFFSLKSEERKKERKQREEQIEQEKEEKREIKIQESIQKNLSNFVLLAKLSFQKNEDIIKAALLKAKISQEFNYDTNDKDLNLKEQKALYELQMEKIKFIQVNFLPSVSRLPAVLLKLYKWHTFSSEYSIHLFDVFKNNGFDLIQETQKLYKDTITFQSEYSKLTSEIDKKYHIVCTTEDRKKKLKKELDRLNKNVIQLSNVKFVENDFDISFDNIVISENGIFCLVIKHLDRERIDKIFISDDEEWTGELGNGDRYYIEPVERQFFNSMKHFQKMINQKLKEKYETEFSYLMAYPVVVVIGEDILIQNESDLPIQKLSNVFNHIQLFKGGKIQQNQLNTLKDILSHMNIGQMTETVQDNIELLEKNAEQLWHISKVVDLVHESALKYCLGIEERKILRAYRQYLAFEHLLTYQKSVKDVHVIYFPSDTSKYPNMIQSPQDPLIDRLVDPCMVFPIKILSRILDMSLLKMEFVLKDIYSVDDLKKMPAISFQYINRALIEIIKSNISEEMLNPFIEVEAYNRLKLYRMKYFDPSS